LRRKRGLERFDHYAATQKRLWMLATSLAEEYELGEPIDVLVDALILYEIHLK